MFQIIKEAASDLCCLGKTRAERKRMREGTGRKKGRKDNKYNGIYYILYYNVL